MVILLGNLSDIGDLNYERVYIFLFIEDCCDLLLYYVTVENLYQVPGEIEFYNFFKG